MSNRTLSSAPEGQLPRDSRIGSLFTSLQACLPGGKAQADGNPRKNAEPLTFAQYVNDNPGKCLVALMNSYSSAQAAAAQRNVL
jgi:hypothetical protein